MKHTIIISIDPAGQNIKNFLDEFGMSYYESGRKSIYCEDIDKEVDGDILIFATTHTSSKGVQSLAIHYPGNWSSADLGGKERNLSVTPASLVKDLFLEMKKQFDGEVTLEATHHGPHLTKPTCFIEIGSSAKEWSQPELGKVIATVLKNVVGKEKKYKAVIGIGGGHYPHIFNKVLERTEYAIGHICPKYKLEDLDEEMLKQAWDNCVEKPEFAILDWKGLGQEKEKILALLEKINIPHKKAKELLK